MKNFNNLEDAMRMIKTGARFKHNGEVYVKETEMAIVNVETGKALIRGLDFAKLVF